MDVTDLESPVEIALTSHIGEAHTVNVDPKRPHIAYAVTSDVIGVDDDGVRANESGGTNLDGFEVVDLSSCMDFPEGTTVEEKREACRPEVYRFRYPSIDIAIGHTNRGEVYGCHELEVYPDDTLTCAAGGALIAFDMAGAFDDNGTPDDFTDDVPRGEPLPCATRPSTTADPVFDTAALVTDCVEGGTDEAPVDLTVQGWLAAGAPALEGVEHLGTAHHQGRGAGEQLPVDDIDFDHEAEFTASGRFLVATDERGGGVVPPDSTCSPGVDNPVGNGGVHAYAVDRLDTTPPGSPEEAFDAYARTPEGDKAVFRAEPRAPGGTFCTAHVLQQLPGENRIVMGWYTQGTQIVDIVEHEDGSFEFVEAAFFIPEGANQWVSHVFDAVDNPDGTVTYTGVAADFGRQAIDVYRVTLPPAPEPLPPFPGGPDFPGADPAPTPTPTDPGVPGGPLVRRIDGGGRVETAVSVSQEAFPDGADTVTLARADDYADALTGGPLAAQLDGPLLLTQRDQLSAPTAEEIDRLGADEVVVFGGDEAVEASVLAELDPALTVRRVEGPNRFATAGAVAADLAASAGPTTTAFLVEGANADPARGARRGLRRPVRRRAGPADPAGDAGVAAGRDRRRARGGRHHRDRRRRRAGRGGRRGGRGPGRPRPRPPPAGGGHPLRHQRSRLPGGGGGRRRARPALPRPERRLRGRPGRRAGGGVARRHAAAGGSGRPRCVTRHARRDRGPGGPDRRGRAPRG